MQVIVDVIDAKTVISVTTRAVPEFEVGIFGIGFAADGAFVPVLPFAALAPRLFRGFFEVDSLR